MTGLSTSPAVHGVTDHFVEQRKPGARWPSRELLDLWKMHGGDWHGPRVETVTMPMYLLTGFLEAAAQVRAGQDGESLDWHKRQLHENQAALIASRESQAAALARATKAEEANERLREVLAKWSRADHIRLHAGEMTAQEMRCVKAVVGAIEREAAALADPATDAAGVDKPPQTRQAGTTGGGDGT